MRIIHTPAVVIKLTQRHTLCADASSVKRYKNNVKRDQKQINNRYHYPQSTRLSIDLHVSYTRPDCKFVFSCNKNAQISINCAMKLTETILPVLPSNHLASLPVIYQAGSRSGLEIFSNSLESHFHRHFSTFTVFTDESLWLSETSQRGENILIFGKSERRTMDRGQKI